MKKIALFLNAESYFGGMFQYNQSILDSLGYLPQNNYYVYVLYTKKEWEKYLKDYNFKSEYVQTNTLTELLSKIGKAFFISGWRKISHNIHPVLKAIHKKKDYTWIFPCQDVYSFQVEVETLTTVHDLMHRYERFPEITNKKEYYSRERLFSNIARFSKGILVDSNCGKKQLIECYGTAEDKIFPLPYIAPKYLFQNIGIDFDEKFELPSKFLFYPAQFWEHKNHIRLFRAVAKAIQKLPDINLVLVGSKKNAFAKAFEIAEELKIKENIFYLGYVEDRYIPTLYKRARALIMPTFFGPTNIPPLEAFALGCPVGISGIYGMPEQCGDAALYFDPLSIDEMATVIEKLWSDDVLCNKLIDRGKAKFQSWGQVEFSERLKVIIDAL